MPRARVIKQRKQRNRNLKGGARSTAAAVTGVLLHPMDSLEELKSFFTDLAGIWNGGNVAEGLRTKGKKAFETVIKYLPLAGAPGYAAATALEKLPINNIIELLATLIDLISGKVDLKHFFEVLKLFIGDIWELIKTLATQVLPKVAETAWNGLVENVGNPIAEAFDPNLKGQRDEYNRQHAELNQFQEAAGSALENVVSTAESQFNNRDIQSPEQVILNLNSINGLSGLYPQLQNPSDPKAWIFVPPYTRNEELETAKFTSAEAFDQRQKALALSQVPPKAMVVPYLLYLRDNQNSWPDYMADAKNLLPDWDLQTWIEKASDNSNNAYLDVMGPWASAIGNIQAQLTQATAANEDLMWTETPQQRQNRETTEMEMRTELANKAITDTDMKVRYDLELKKDDLLTDEDQRYQSDYRHKKYEPPDNNTVSDETLEERKQSAIDSHTIETYMRQAKAKDDEAFKMTVDPLEPDDNTWPKLRKAFFEEADRWLARARREGGGEAVDEYERTSKDLRDDLFGDVEEARADAAKAKEDATKKAAEDAAKAKTDEEARKLALEKDKFQMPYEGFTDRNNGDMTEDEKSKFNDFISQPGNMDYTTGIGYYPPGMRDTVKKRIAAKNAPPAEPAQPAATATGAGHPLGWKLGKRYREQQFDRRFFE